MDFQALATFRFRDVVQLGDSRVQTRSLAHEELEPLCAEACAASLGEASRQPRYPVDFLVRKAALLDAEPGNETGPTFSFGGRT
jgi:hypothetical protein